MSSFATRCSVLQHRAVERGDRAADGTATDDAVRRWIAQACAAYLDQCRVLQHTRSDEGLVLRTEIAVNTPSAGLGNPTRVAVSASATEVLPSAFVVGIRIRAGGGDTDAFVHATCTVRLEDPVTGAPHPIGEDVRDELIALEHSARHLN